MIILLSDACRKTRDLILSLRYSLGKKGNEAPLKLKNLGRKLYLNLVVQNILPLGLNDRALIPSLEPLPHLELGFQLKGRRTQGGHSLTESVFTGS